jgi:hypothetical protein
VDISGFIDSVVSFAQSNTFIAAVLALFLLFFIYQNPKLFFGLLIFALILVGLYSLITNMARSGSQQKQKLLPGEETQSQQRGPWPPGGLQGVLFSQEAWANSAGEDSAPISMISDPLEPRRVCAMFSKPLYPFDSLLSTSRKARDAFS